MSLEGQLLREAVQRLQDLADAADKMRQDWEHNLTGAMNLLMDQESEARLFLRKARAWAR